MTSYLYSKIIIHPEFDPPPQAAIEWAALVISVSEKWALTVTNNTYGNTGDFDGDPSDLLRFLQTADWNFGGKDGKLVEDDEEVVHLAGNHWEIRKKEPAELAPA